MKMIVPVVLLLLLIPMWRAPAQRSEGDWEPFWELKDQLKEQQRQQKKQEQPAQVLTNESIIKLVRARLSEDTIIKMVDTQPGNYSLGADDVIVLKRSGVSEKIMSAMLNKPATKATAPAEKQADTTNTPDPSHQMLAGRPLAGVDSNLSASKHHGLYYESAGGLVPIEGQVASFRRTGSLLSSAATFGIKSRKGNVQILGRSSTHVTSTRPVFQYRVASGTDSAGGSAGDLVLIQLDVSHNRRQFEVGAQGAGRASSGISIRSQVPVNRKQIEPDLYRLTPNESLEPGQYAFYLYRGYDLPGYVYDFSVE